MDLIIDYLSQGIGAIVPFILLLGALVFVHELGHFLVARWCGVRVEVFSLGFGKKIFKFQRGPTTYAISLIPLGGYVKMFGEQNGAEIPEAERGDSFTHKGPWRRIAIVAAGPLMNFFFAALVFSVLAFWGEEYAASKLGDIPMSSAAYEAGFRSGDRILMVNKNPIQTWDELQENLDLFRDKSAEFEVVHEFTGEKETLTAKIQSKENFHPLSTNPFIGDIEGLSVFSSGTTVGVRPSSRLFAFGLRTGDVITYINGQEVRTWRDLEHVLKAISKEQSLSIEALDGEDKKRKATKSLNIASLDQEVSAVTLGIESSEVYIGKVRPGSPAEKAGLKPFDRIASINGAVIQSWSDVLTNVRNYQEGSPLKFQVIRNEGTQALEMVPEMTTQMTPYGAEDKRFTVGVEAMVNMAKPETFIKRIVNPIYAASRGLSRSVDLSVMTVMSFVRLIQQKISHKNIGGVISIGQAASEAFKVGWTYFLQMMGILSINLFVLNLLPVPVLDGGHLLFYTIELIKGSPLSMSKLEVAQQIGLVLLLALMILSLFNDVTRIFGL